MATLSKLGEVIAQGTVTSASERAYLSNQLLALANGGYKTPSKNPDTRKYLETVQALCTTDVWKIKSGEYLNKRLKSIFFREVALLIRDESIPMLSLKSLHYLAIYFNRNSHWKNQFAIAANSLNSASTEGKYFYEFIKKQIGRLKRQPTSVEDWAIFFSMSIEFVYPLSLISFSMKYFEQTKSKIIFSKFSFRKLETIDLVIAKKKSFNKIEWEYFEMLLDLLPIADWNRFEYIQLIVGFFKNAFPFLENKIGNDHFFFVLWIYHSTSFRINEQSLRKLSTIDKYRRFASTFSKFYYLKMDPAYAPTLKKFRCTPFINLMKFLPNDMLHRINSYPLELVVHLAGGNNIRNNFRNIPFTKKMAHLFSDNSDYVFVWLKSLGADGNFCQLIRNNLQRDLMPAPNDNLVHSFDRYSMFFKKMISWEEEIRAYSILTERHMNGLLQWLLGYIHHLIQDEPDFDLKGRTFASFARLATEYTELQQVRRNSIYRTHQVWKGADYTDLEIKIDNEAFQIIQIKTYKELVKEGQVMSHCVGGYSGKCYFGDLSIWSLRQKVGDDLWKSEVTMEILKSRRIVQAKAKYNSRPDDKFLNIIKEWAKRERLAFVRC